MSGDNLTNEKSIPACITFILKLLRFVNKLLLQIISAVNDFQLDFFESFTGSNLSCSQNEHSVKENCNFAKYTFTLNIKQEFLVHSTNVIQLLKTLSKDEFTEFEKFVISPYFNRKIKVTELFYILKKFHPDFKAPDIKRENIFEVLYSGKKFNYGVLKNLFHELNKLGEKFLELKGFEEDEFERRMQLGKELIKRELFTANEKNIKATQSLLNNRADSSGERFLKLYRFEKTKYYQEYFRSGDKDFSKKRISENFMQRESYIRQFYLITLSDLLGEIIAENMIFKSKVPVEISEKAVLFFKENVDSDNPALKLRAHKLMLELNNDDESQYTVTKELISKNEEFLRNDKEFAYNFFITVLNFINYRLLEGHDEYYYDAFEVLARLVEYDILSVFNKIPLVLFREILKVSIKTEKFDFAEEFFNKFKGRIETESLDSEYNRYKSQEFFQKKEFEKSLEHLSSVKFGDVNIKWSIHVLTVKNYLELRRFAETGDAINAARQFIRYNRNFMEKSYESRERFLKVMEKIIRLMDSTDNSDAEYLMDEISRSNFVDRNWCLEKLRNIISGG